MITLPLPQKICVSFCGHLSTIFIRHSCCFTVVAQEDLQIKVKKAEILKTAPDCLVSLSFQISHTVGHTFIHIASKGCLHFNWKITDQISLRMHWGSGEGSSAET